MSNLNLRLAQAEDVSCAMDFIQQGKDYMKEQGLEQWNDAYPAMEDIETDISGQKGWFLCDGEEKIGYFCVDFDGEEAYNDLEGQWLTAKDAQYMVIHRLAFGAKHRGKGLGSAVFSLAEDICRERGVHSIRVDTHPDNQPMQHLIRKAGYTYCGIVYYFGSPRTAFEKLL